jgi:zinc transport system ATP-binding protein
MKVVDMKVVELKEVWVRLGNQLVLEDINFEVFQGDYIGIIGPNGAGKTTLLKVILGLIKPFKGEVRVFGLEPQEGKKFIGYVPQERPFNRDFPLKVMDVVLMGCLKDKGLFRNFSAEDFKRAEEVLELVEMLPLKDREIGSLSGGELQRVLIARALVSKPKLFLLDEPTAHVDLPVQTEFFDLLKRLNEEGLTIIMVTHDVGVLSSYVGKIACLNRKIYYHSTKEIRPEELEAVYGCPVDLIAHGVPHRVLREHH